MTETPNTNGGEIASFKRKNRVKCDWTDLMDSRPDRFYSAAALHAMQSAVIPTAIPSVRLSVCPSVTRWYPIQTNEHRITRSSL